MIARIWRGWVRTEQAAAAVGYINQTGMAEYVSTPGNLGAQLLTRDLGDGRTEVVALSWWESFESIKAFAGEDIEAAVTYPEDAGYILGQESRVTHFEVVSAL